MSIFGTLFAVGIIGGGIWLLSGNRQVSKSNLNQNFTNIAKANAPAVSNQIENQEESQIRQYYIIEEDKDNQYDERNAALINQVNQHNEK